MAAMMNWRRPPSCVCGSSSIEFAMCAVRGDGVVLGEVLASQAGVHELWGGVVPKLAMEAHRAAIDRTVDETLRLSGVHPSKLSAIAVTVGPGLSLCLGVGVKKVRMPPAGTAPRPHHQSHCSGRLVSVWP